MKQQRAKAGGEVGSNGEWYAGGKFIATTDKPKSQPKPKGRNKSEIEKYVWAMPPEDMSEPRSIYAVLAGSYIDRDWKPFIPYCAYQGVKPESIQNLIDLYRAGQRWIEGNELRKILSS